MIILPCVFSDDALFLHSSNLEIRGKAEKNEKITITLIPTAEMTTSVTILSECGMPTQVIDWGKNRQNVCNIYEHIVRMLSAANVPTTPTQSPAPAPAQNPIPEQNTEAPKPSVSFCNSCGTRVVPGSIFCSGCGKKL